MPTINISKADPQPLNRLNRHCMNLVESFNSLLRWFLNNGTWCKGRAEIQGCSFYQFNHSGGRIRPDEHTVELPLLSTPEEILSFPLSYMFRTWFLLTQWSLSFSFVHPRIDANTDDIESNVAGAQTELLKYYSYVSSNRWLMVKVFAVIISSAVTLSVLSWAIPEFGDEKQKNENSSQTLCYDQQNKRNQLYPKLWRREDHCATKNRQLLALPERKQ